jgi:hypothetical protein
MMVSEPADDIAHTRREHIDTEPLALSGESALFLVAFACKRYRGPCPRAALALRLLRTVAQLAKTGRVRLCMRIRLAHETHLLGCTLDAMPSRDFTSYMSLTPHVGGDS